ncbi:MAG: hypothetical protein QNJ36_01325 [Calothrix sp. MO_167.B42]|nr:hypothetical protein [Calothrix sp. MO_167.B42]
MQYASVKNNGRVGSASPVKVTLKQSQTYQKLSGRGTASVNLCWL